jgi:hypothetical protein
MNKLKGFLHRFFFFSQDNNACIFTAYYEGGNMANAIKKARGKLFPEEVISLFLIYSFVSFTLVLRH